MRFLSYFSPLLPRRFVYMLQQVEYKTVDFYRWLLRIPDLHKIEKRGRLDLTSRAKLTILAGYFAMVLAVCLTAMMVTKYSNIFAGLFLFSPLFIAVIIGVFNKIFGALVVRPFEHKEIEKAKQKLMKMNAVRVAVMGSYGKTTMKETLATVLSQSKKVAYTPGNKNVLISHARWINNEISGDEKVLIFEYGEASPGDISRLAAFSEPHHAIITGLAPAHMEHYGTLEAVAEDFISISEYVEKQNTFINNDSTELKNRLSEVGVKYSSINVDDWNVTTIDVSLQGLKFTMSKKKLHLTLSSRLLGRHNIGPLAAVAAISHRLGLTIKQIEAGIALTKPYEHRMNHYKLGSADIIDDTYNGNIEGMKAGLALLSELKSKRKIYITPGMVEQGNLTQQVHIELGKAIAQAGPDRVVLMKNSVTDYIMNGLESHGYNNELVIEENPLEFYTNLEHYVAAGDLVLMQNDWTDNYS